MSELILRNRQRSRFLNLPLFRRIAVVLLEELLGLERYQLGVHLVAASEMICLNRRFLNHDGSTDVITFDYSRDPLETRNPKPETVLHGEIFICLDDAVAQARSFRATWQSELVRYLAHGALHLGGYDDLQPAGRRVMKREEDRLVRALSLQFSLKRLAKAGPAPARKSQAANRTASFP